MELLPAASQVVAWLSLVHSAALFVLRTNSHETESVHIGMVAVVMDAMSVPMAYYFPYFRWAPVRRCVFADSRACELV